MAFHQPYWNRGRGSVLSNNWWDQLAKELPQDRVLLDFNLRKKLSRDYSHFSPVLAKALEHEIADCVVKPETGDELDIVLSFAATNGIKVTVRGAGTGNYGQSVPIGGGILIDMSRLNKIISLNGCSLTAQAGAKMGKMEQYARGFGAELFCYPSTFQTATIGGFISGGSGGIGSVANGTIWDGMVRGITVKTLEPAPRTYRVEGEDVTPYIHSYGTIGVFMSIEITVKPMKNWRQWAISFDNFDEAMTFAMELSGDDQWEKRLVSVHEWPIPRYFKPLKGVVSNKSLLLLEIDDRQSESLQREIRNWRGEVILSLPPEKYHRVTGVSDFSFNHTTLWVRRSDPNFTYLQITLDNSEWKAQKEMIQARFPEVYMHVELIRNQGRLSISGLPIVRFTTEERLNLLMEFCETVGVRVANPHTWKLEFGGRCSDPSLLFQLKQRNDPMGLLNPHKLNVGAESKRPVWFQGV